MDQNTEKMELIEAALLANVSGGAERDDGINICGASCHIFSIDVCNINICSINLPR